MQNTSYKKLGETEEGMKTGVRNINNVRNADDTIFLEESTNDLKGLLMKTKEENAKAELH